MKPWITIVRRLVLVATLGGIAGLATPASAQMSDAIRIVAVQEPVEILPHGSDRWMLTATNQLLYPFDRVRTGTNGSIGLLWSDQSVLRFGALTELEILPPSTGDSDHGLHLIRGILSFFHRAKPGRIRVITSSAFAGIEGTEFVMEAGAPEGTEQTTLSVIDGKVRFGNDTGTLVLTNGEQAVAQIGKAPMRTSGFIANNLLQWCFYYPGVLDADELPLTGLEKDALQASLAAYRAGDLPAALAKFPGDQAHGSNAERIYHAALLLGAGQVAEAEVDLSTLQVAESSSTSQRLATALRTLIAAVKRDSRPSATPPQLASEYLAASYFEQSRAIEGVSLPLALQLASQAATNSPGFGFAWERVAELEFSFGHIDRASAALDNALRLSPRNAQALALKGFLLAAQNQVRNAIEWFDRAIAADPYLGNAWLGRGLCRIRRGDAQAGREDLLIAAALEPQRAALRSYLGKAYGDAGDDHRAFKELERAKTLDKNDPTAWLYSALLNQQGNRVNDAIRDLEHSEDLNNNRGVYRSTLMVDQDQAVRSANLARIYDDAGMPEVAFREAVHSVNSDYDNYSAHLFLANSYNQLRDPNLVNLRFEPAETREYLVANLLAPVSAGTLSPAISQQEYSKLFESDGPHLFTDTGYLSRGAWNQSAALYGTFGNTGYSLDSFYRTDPGQRVNNDIQELNETVSLKQQITPKDSVYLQVGWFHTEGGDLAQRYDPATADPLFRSEESQHGSLLAGYHHEWQPGMDTLVLAGRVPDHTSFSDGNGQTLAFDPFFAMAGPNPVVEQYQSDLTLYLLEVQQLIRHNDKHDTIVGVKFDYGSLDVDNAEISSGDAPAYFPDPGQTISQQSLSLSIERFDAYVYHRWEVVDALWLQAGISYDWVKAPENFLSAPLSDQETTRDQVSPKFGVVWNPLKNTTVRAAYTRSLTGASFEQSLSLEPAQVAGFTQAYRDVVPESAIGGPTPATPFDAVGVALDQKFPTGTYVGLNAQMIDSTFNQTVGGYNLNFDPVTFTYSLAGPSGAREHVDYNEKSLVFTVNQLVARDFSFGLAYTVTRSQLEEQLTEVESPVLPLTNGKSTIRSVLQQLNLNATWNHPSGFFAQFNALWSQQSNEGFSPEEPGDSFWQLNFLAGYRFPRRQAQISIGILNLTDRDYRLEPLTPYNDLPRTRTIAAQASFSF